MVGRIGSGQLCTVAPVSSLPILTASCSARFAATSTCTSSRPSKDLRFQIGTSRLHQRLDNRLQHLRSLHSCGSGWATRHKPGADTPSPPRAVAARFDTPTGRVVGDLANGCALAFPARALQGMADASDSELATVEVLGLDVSFYRRHASEPARVEVVHTITSPGTASPGQPTPQRHWDHTPSIGLGRIYDFGRRALSRSSMSRIRSRPLTASPV